MVSWCPQLKIFNCELGKSCEETLLLKINGAMPKNRLLKSEKEAPPLPNRYPFSAFNFGSQESGYEKKIFLMFCSYRLNFFEFA